MATQSQKRRMLRSGIRGAKKAWLSNEEIVGKIQWAKWWSSDKWITTANPNFQKEDKRVTTINPNSKKWKKLWLDQKAWSLSVTGDTKVTKTAENTNIQQEQVPNVPVTEVNESTAPTTQQDTETTQVDTSQPQIIPTTPISQAITSKIDNFENNITPEPEIVDQAPIQMDLQQSSPFQIAQWLRSGNITMMDFQNLSQTNPELYQLAQLEKQKIETSNKINQWGQDYIDTINNLNKQFNEKLKSVWWAEAVEEFRSFLPENSYADQLQKKAVEIAEIDNARRTVFEDTKRETWGADMGYILAKVRNKDQLMLDERTIAVAEYGALQSQYETENSRALQEYNIYKQGEAQKMELEFNQLEQSMWMSKMQYEQNQAILQSDYNKITQAKQEVSTYYDNEEAIAQQLVAQQQQRQENEAMLSLYDDFSIEQKAGLANLSADGLMTFLKKHDDLGKGNFSFHELDDWSFVSFNKDTGKTENKYTPPVPWSSPATQENGEQWWPCGVFASRSAGLWYTPWGDDKALRKQLFNDETPAVWGLVFFDWDKYDTTYGHIARVEAINQDWTVDLVESNYNGDEKVTRRTISSNEVWLSGFYNNTPLANEIKTSREWYNENLRTFYIEFNATGELTSAMQQWLKDEGIDLNEFGRQANNYKRQVTDLAGKDVARDMLDELHLLRDMVDKSNSTQRNVSWWMWWASQWSAELDAQWNYIADNLTLDKFLDLKAWWATFGAMSSDEWRIIWAAASKMRKGAWEDITFIELDDFISRFMKEVPDYVYEPKVKESTTQTEWQTEGTGTISTWSISDAYEKQKNPVLYIHERQ